MLNIKEGHKTQLQVIICIGLLFCSISLIHASRYIPDVYVCRHMARDIEDVFESVGIPIVLVKGNTDDRSTSHMWVSIYGVELDSVFLIPNGWFDKYSNNKICFDDWEDYIAEGGKN